MEDNRVIAWRKTLNFLEEHNVEFETEHGVEKPNFREVAKKLGMTNKKLNNLYQKRWNDFIECNTEMFQGTLMEDDSNEKFNR